jgi:Flp pilus assembly pilin Flp
MRNEIVKKLRSLHRDERGADMVEYILIVAAVALPLLAFIIFFWKQIREWVTDLWTDVKEEAEEGMNN